MPELQVILRVGVLVETAVQEVLDKALLAQLTYLGQEALDLLVDQIQPMVLRVILGVPL